ncbi:hypothetical protein BDV19DRAFT_69030 [Aspergillus venezuelensis]
MVVGESLASIGLRVSRQFRAAEQLEKGGAISNEHQRYELWANSLGLYHGGHSSLDYRFRDSAPLLAYASGLLHDLETTLSNHAKGVTDEADVERPTDDANMEDYSDGGSEEDFSSYLDQHLSISLITNIVATVDRLYRLAFKIRNPAMRSGLSKALTYAEIDPDTGVDIIEGYRAADLDHLKNLFRSYGHTISDDPKNLHYLVRRLAKANTRRRQQFKYWRKRKIKYERVINPDSGPLAHTDALTSDVPKLIDVQIGHLALAAPSQPSSATRLNPAKVKLDDDLSVVTTTSFVALSDERFGDHLAIPPPPSLRPDAKELECPYCYTICPKKTFLGTAWE